MQRERRGGGGGRETLGPEPGPGGQTPTLLVVSPRSLEVSPLPLHTSGLLVATCTRLPADFSYPKLSQAGGRMAWTLQTRGHTSAHPSSLGAWSRCVGASSSLQPLSWANRDTWSALLHSP